jgi:hypothetical protein
MHARTHGSNLPGAGSDGDGDQREMDGWMEWKRVRRTRYVYVRYSSWAMARLELGTSSVVLCHASMHVVRSACAQRPAPAVVTHSPEPVERAARAHGMGWAADGGGWPARSAALFPPTALHCTGQLSLVRTQEETPTGPRQRARPGHGGPGARAGTRGRLLH